MCLAGWERASAVDGRGDERDENDVNHQRDPRNLAASARAPILCVTLWSLRKRDSHRFMRICVSRYVGLAMAPS